VENFYLIGLIGQIGSGKSTVRKMLEQLGAYSIDADMLARVVVRRGTLTWSSIVDAFGVEILRFDGNIDRGKLATRVFAHPPALEQLEALVHPAVRALTKDLLLANQKSIVVVEAIKLIEAGMHKWCDAVWAIDCKTEAQIERLKRTRKMSEQDARARLALQGSFAEHLRLANVVIDNSGDKAATRAQVEKAWKNIRVETARDKREWLLGLPRAEPAPLVEEPAPTIPPPVETVPDWAKDQPVVQVGTAPATIPDWAKSRAEIQVRRSRRNDLEALAVALAKKEKRDAPFSREETIRRFGERGYRIALMENRIVALVAWEAENLVATVREIWTESAEIAELALPRIFELVENEARELLCEVIVLLIPHDAPVDIAVQAHVAGYEIQDFDSLHKLWRQAIQERMQTGDQLWSKTLRTEMITKPF
jgi:dephospho-CoA kinase